MPDVIGDSESIDALKRVFDTRTELVDVDGKPGGMEMLSLHLHSYTIPGRVVTVLALFDDSKLVDVIVRSASTRLENHNIRFSDIDADGSIDAIIDIEPGFWRYGDSNEAIVYSSSTSGLHVLSRLAE